MRKISVLLLAAAAILSGGCGSGKASAPVPPKTTVIDDKPGGFRIAVPEGWEREVLPLSDPRRRWFAARWKPANVAIPPEALLVHLMAPGCPAAELGGKYAGKPFASETKIEGFSIVASAPGTVGNRAAFRLDGKYKCEKYGEVFEASAYIETGAGTGYFVTSRGTAADEAATKLRLEAALGGFDAMEREIRVEKTTPHAGGLTIGFPAGFDEFFGPAALGTAAYAVGASDVQGRQETISLLLAPPIPNGEAFLNSMLAEASKGFGKGEPRKMNIADHPVEASLLTAPDSAPPYDVAFAVFNLGNTPAALCVNACKFPPGRAMSVLEEVGKTIRHKAQPPPKLSPRTFGDPAFRSSLTPEGWNVNAEATVIAAAIKETVPSADGGEPKQREAMVIEATVDEDYRGDGTPGEMARQQARSFDPKKFRVVAVDDFSLKDGRPAARLVVATPISYEFFLFVRATPGSLAQVHVSALPALAELGLRLGVEILAATKFVPLGEQPVPAEAVLAASRKELPALIQRGRGRAAGEAWYLEESGGKEFGGQHLQVGENGVWADRERRPSPGSSVESRMTGAPGTYRESVILNSGAKGPSPKPAPSILESDTKIDATAEGEIVFWRLRPGGTEQRDRASKPDPFVPPDLSASDGLLVALAESPEGTYAFASLQERFLFIRWKEYRVKGLEDVEVPAGKFKARRIETGSKAVYWVAEGKVVKADLGDFVRKLAPEAAVKKYLQD